MRPRLVTTLLALALLTALPGTALAQFRSSDAKDVGVIFMPFEAARAEEDALAFLLEDLVGAKLMRRIRHPVHTGRNVTVALSGTPATCLRQPDCVRLLGGQFNSSLVASTLVTRDGAEVRVAVDWYTTGNGYKAARESVSFPIGAEDRMIEALAGWFDTLFEPSLLVTPESGASEGAVIGGTASDARVEELKRGKEKKVSSRREDFGDAPADRDEVADPAADLRAEVEEPRPPKSTTRTRERTDEVAVDVSDLEDDDEPEEARAPVSRAEPRTKPTKTRPARREETEPVALEDDDSEVDLDRLDVDDQPDEELSLDAGERRGDSVSNYMDAQRLGIGKREYNRMARTGLPFDEFVARRWAHGGRLHFRVGGFYGFGGLTRRYSSTIFIRAGNAKTEEFAWESLGGSAVNPGGSIGFGVAPIDLLEIGLDVGVMYAKQDLRREYDGHETGSNIPAVPDSAATAHVVADLSARLLLLPKRKVKIAPKLGATLLFLAGYDIVSEPPLDYTDRPPAVVVGVTAGVGVLVALSPFVGLDVDLSGTFYVAQGAAKFDTYDYFGGVTEPYLTQELLQQPLPSIPVMGRLTIGPRFFF